MGKIKYIYRFGLGFAEGTKEMKNLLGGKGANLHEMCNLGLNVPPGFTISTEACNYFYENDGRFPEELEEAVAAEMKYLGERMGRFFGDEVNPLLVSVRSGARASMPGMMDTVLNLGLNDRTVKGLAAKSGSERFAYDCYRRFVAMFGDVVLGLRPESGEQNPFEVILQKVKKRTGKKLEIELSVDEFKELVTLFKAEIKERKKIDFPEDPYTQLRLAISAVFRSWMNPRAIAYRKMYNYPDSWGTAVNVQTMVFGNMSEDSGTGVFFTRDSGTGENRPTGEFLMLAQGEDVVAGIRTPRDLSQLKDLMPAIYDELLRIREKLERHYRDMQDIEFTIEKGKLYVLQTRNGKRTGLAGVKIACDMLEEGLIEEKDVLTRIEPNALTQLLRPIFDQESKKTALRENRLLARGLNAGPGAATGAICFFAEEVEKAREKFKRVILVRIETSPEDIKGMENADGILTARGGMTSHAALVARQRGKVCVTGCDALEIDYAIRTMRVGEKRLKEGDFISIDGSTGEVFEGEISMKPSEIVNVLINKSMKPEESVLFLQFRRVMEIADKYRLLGVRTNADRPSEAELAIAFGAEGIGLCRTEHMFFEGDRIKSMRKMILSDTDDERQAALEELLPFQQRDFEGIFRAMAGKPVTIRTLDPPLHEFLPQKDKEINELSRELGISVEKVKERINSLHEANPMLGHRGCRLGITSPEITEMQARAIFEAAVKVKMEGIEVKPEIMIPLVGHVNELRNQERIVRMVAEEVFRERGVKVDYLIGTMIEVPRAAVTADEIATAAEFFSFGTNDLTQMGFGMSRDDYGKFIMSYLDKRILETDPFVTIDAGIGELMRIAKEKGRGTRNDLKVGICGEHGGDPDSIEFCHKIGLDYVSCSPFRVPVARFAAAAAAVKSGDDED